MLTEYNSADSTFSDHVSEGFRNNLSNTKIKASVFDDWRIVPKEYATRNKWTLRFRKIKPKQSPAAQFRIVQTRKLETVNHEYECEKFISLYHISQTSPVKRTQLNVAQHLYYRCFVEPADRTKLIRWTQGAWEYDGEEKYWDAEADNWGWRHFKEGMGLQHSIDHIRGKDIFGIFGSKSSYCLIIDLDYHGKDLDLFQKRLRALLELFHSKYRCHFQVSENNAGGVHLILFFGKNSSLKSRRRWLWKQLAGADRKDPELNFTGGDLYDPQFNVEVYPDKQRGVRLPLARGRTMLLNKPLDLITNRGKEVQDVVEYIRWLGDPDRQYMPKEDVYRYVVERLDVVRTAEIKEPKQQKTVVQKVTKSQKQEKRSLKGKTRGAIIGFWKNGNSKYFVHLNAAINTTLQALHAEGLTEEDAVDFVMGYVEELSDKTVSSRLDNIPEVRRVAERTARKIWNSPISVKWQKSLERWNDVGFRVSDKTTWTVTSKKYEDVVVDCPELVFTEDEKDQLITEMTPLLVGAKQAQKQEKQEEVIRAVAYFLRYVRCCSREIPVENIPKILSDYQINIKNHSKQTAFFRLLIEWCWIYVRTEYCHPLKHGKMAGAKRARAYGIGKPFVDRLNAEPVEQSIKNTNQTTQYNMDLYMSPTFWGRPEITGIFSFEDQLEEDFADYDQTNIHRKSGE
ncbi:hypothetical protein V6x_56730 [Gimesia chilikensis]|uniref:Uncharacterized protein n=1 Tax=Gimesia chilikensis TaxID=2605989 RepID=A0A517WKZ5_9PLAN|nr:hypothetical protein [Gimesia chilikensis]QDU05929.1 hypothetical protein V6x_56730 [Gimesia chilikensis]